MLRDVLIPKFWCVSYSSTPGGSVSRNSQLEQLSLVKLNYIDRLNQRTHNALYDNNDKVGSADKLRTYKTNKMLNYVQNVLNFKHRNALKNKSK